MSDNIFKSIKTMDINCNNVKFCNGEGIQSELIQFNNVRVFWRMVFYPRCLPKIIEDHYEPVGQHSLIKFIIEDHTDEKIQYNCHFKCEGSLELNWNTDFSNSEDKVIYDSSMKQTMKRIERTHTIPIAEWDFEIYDKFKIKVEIKLEIFPKVKHMNSSWSSIEVCSGSESDYIVQIDKSFSVGDKIAPTRAPTSARSPAFLACISKIMAESKGEDGLPDLIKLATQLLEAAKKFELPDLKKIAAGFLDFQISNENFADILEMAVDQKIPALSNLSTDFITKNQRELRQTEQWAKMKACPLMMFSVMEKLFIENNS